MVGEHKDVWGVWRQPARWALIWLDETTAEVSRFGREVLGACGGRRRNPAGQSLIVVGLDGGYVRDWEDRKTNFEVIVGQSVPEDRDARYVGLVHTYDSKPKRRLFDLLKSQGLQANQDVTFLTDGGEGFVR